MTPDGKPERRHLRVDTFFRSSAFKSVRGFGGNGFTTPGRQDREGHGGAMLSQYREIETDYATLAQSWENHEAIKARGIIVEFEGPPGVRLNLESLAGKTFGLELLNQRPESQSDGQVVWRETWFVPDGKLEVLKQIFDEYLTKERGPNGLPYRRGLVDSIERFRLGAAKELWTEKEPFPAEESVWFEVWLRAGANRAERDSILKQFQVTGERAGLRVGGKGANKIELPEHTIVAAYGPGAAFSSDLALLNCIAEIRFGRDYADFFDNLQAADQAAWSQDILERVDLPADANVAVCVLDTGINRAHPMLSQSLASADNLSIRVAWPAADDDNHGTPMAGLALWGHDLPSLLAGTARLQLPFILEGVKIVAPPDQRPNDEKIAGAYTAQGVAVAEGNAPKRRRVFCLATSLEGPNEGKPSSWSAELDNLATGSDNEGVERRLFCLSAGNVHAVHWKDYPDVNHLETVQNPAQAWNALCVGSCTDLHLIQAINAAYEPLAPRGGMAPSNSTSLLWSQEWPNKPDIVMEGGNAGLHTVQKSTFQLPELLLLSTYEKFNDATFCTMNGTSPATALASRMAARLISAYPDFWPETIRGLMVHSARWTPAMRQACEPLLNDKGNPQTDRQKRKRLLRTVGYGVPDYAEAVESQRHRATLVAQSEIQPFRLEDSDVVYNVMHLHTLPWPKELLEHHWMNPVNMRVTLSYFVEPNPGNRGYTSTYRYAGCQLRFRVSGPGQTSRDLEAQVNKVALEEMRMEDEDAKPAKGNRKEWQIGTPSQHGSVHSDVWSGTGADLASMGFIAVYPVTGWWRTRPSRGRVTARQKYSLYQFAR